MIKNRLKEVRSHQGLSQLELAYKAKVNPSVISTIENGKTYPYPGWRKRISEALEVPESEIWEDEE